MSQETEIMVRNIMTPDCIWIAPNATLREAAEIMRDRDFGFLPVGEDDRLIGMITDRDIVIRAAAEGMDMDQACAGDIMTEQTFYCYDDQDIDEVCANMAEIHVRRLPVVDRHKKLVGIVSLGDLSQAAANRHIGETEERIAAAPAQHRMAA